MKWKEILKGVAPTLATAMGGPLAGLATKTITDKLLGKESATDSEIYEALINPDGLAKLKEIDNDFKARMRELEIDLERIAVDDRKSARKLATDTGTQPQVIISGVFVVGFFVILLILFQESIVLTNTQENIAYMLLGTLASSVTLILKFWFGGGPNDGYQIEKIYNSIPSDKIKK